MAGKTHRKIDAMHTLYGTRPGRKCGDCDYLCSYLANRRYYKCRLYGVSSSEATDWRLSYEACGQIDRPGQVINPRYTVLERIKRERLNGCAVVLDGQIAMDLEVTGDAETSA